MVISFFFFFTDVCPFIVFLIYLKCDLKDGTDL